MIYQPIVYEQASEELKVLYDEILKTLDLEVLPNWVIYMGSNIEVLSGYWVALSKIMLKGNINRILQELIIFAISKQNASPYCTEFHAANCLKLTKALSYDNLLSIYDGKSNAVVPDSFQVAIDFALGQKKRGCLISKEEQNKLADVGFNAQDVIEINALVSLAHLFNQYTSAAAIPIEPVNAIKNFSSRD